MIELRTDLSPEEWDRAACGATLYHRHGWTELLRVALGHRVARLAAVEAGQVVGILPVAVVRSPLQGTFAVSLPTVSYGGIHTCSAEAARALASAALQWAREQGARWVLLRQCQPAPTGWPETVSRVSVVLPLSPDPWRALDPKVRNQVRKAERCGVAISAGDPVLFQRVYARCMRDLGSPALGLEYFRELAARFPAETAFHLVTRGGRLIGGAVTLHHARSLEVPWACSLRAHRQACPQMLLYWELIAAAAKRGEQELDFGRSAPGSGPHRFKLQWGGQERPLSWQYWSADGRPPETGSESRRYRVAAALWKHVPMPIASRLGPRAARWLP